MSAIRKWSSNLQNYLFTILDNNFVLFISFQVSYSPFYYELIFSQSVQFGGHLVFTDTELVLHLEKERPGDWTQLGRQPTREESKTCR